MVFARMAATALLRYCAIALAAQRMFPNSVHVAVNYGCQSSGAHLMVVHAKGPTQLYHLGESSYKFLEDFDDGHTVAPCVFEMKESSR